MPVRLEPAGTFDRILVLPERESVLTFVAVGTWDSAIRTMLEWLREHRPELRIGNSVGWSGAGPRLGLPHRGTYPAMKWDNSEPARYQRAVWKHWIDRLAGIFALGFLVWFTVRVSTTGVNTDLEASQYVWAALILALLLLSTYTGARAWLRSGPKVPEYPLGKRISDEVMDFGHGEFDPVWMRRSAVRGLAIWGAVAFAAGAFYYLADDDLRPLGLVVGGFAMILVVFTVLAVVKIDRKRAEQEDGA